MLLFVDRDAWFCVNFLTDVVVGDPMNLDPKYVHSFDMIRNSDESLIMNRDLILDMGH